MDLEAPGIKIDGFGSPRYHNPWLWKFQASKSIDVMFQALDSMDLEAPGIKIDGFGGPRY